MRNVSISNSKLLFRLIFEPNLEKVYTAMPLTHFSGVKDQKAVDKFIKKLEKWFIIFDPREIDGQIKKVFDRIIKAVGAR